MVNQTLIASIDPGQTIGIAIAKVQVSSTHVWLNHGYLGSTEDMYEVLQLIEVNKCEHVAMERRPANADTSSPVVVSYDGILSRLQLMGYKEHPHFQLMEKSISLITPGIWKPVMKNVMIGGGRWQVKDAHQHDALAILHYVVKLNHMKKEVNYV